MSDLVFQLVYSSISDHEITEEEVENILESALRHNQKNNITGILLFRNRMFLQLLEGDKSSVQETLLRIMDDDRHYGITILAQREQVPRIYTDWSMLSKKISKEEFQNAGLGDDLIVKVIYEHLEKFNKKTSSDAIMDSMKSFYFKNDLLKKSS